MSSFLDRFRRREDDHEPEPPSAPPEPEPIAEPESPGQPAAHEPESKPAPRPHHVSKPPRIQSTEERGVGPGAPD